MPEEDKWALVSVRVSPEEHARLLGHYEYWRSRHPLEPETRAPMLRHALHHGLDAMDREVLGGKIEPVTWMPMSSLPDSPRKEVFVLLKGVVVIVEFDGERFVQYDEGESVAIEPEMWADMLKGPR